MGKYWRRLGAAEKTFLVLIVLYALLYFSGVAPALAPVVSDLRVRGKPIDPGALNRLLSTLSHS